MSERVDVYTTRICPYCVRAKSLLQRRGIPYREVDVSSDADKREWLVQATGGRRTVPQIFIDGEPVGGSDELHDLDRSGELARRLGLTPPLALAFSRGSTTRAAARRARAPRTARAAAPT